MDVKVDLKTRRDLIESDIRQIDALLESWTAHRARLVSELDSYDEPQADLLSLLREPPSSKEMDTLMHLLRRVHDGTDRGELVATLRAAWSDPDLPTTARPLTPDEASRATVLIGRLRDRYMESIGNEIYID